MDANGCRCVAGRLMKLRVMLVEDQTMVREGLLSLLARMPDIEVVASTGSGLEAVRLAATLSPDVVLMDIGLPDLSGIEATRQIVAMQNGTKVLCLSGHEDRQHVDAALRAGATGYQIKNSGTQELVEAILAVGAGRSYLNPAVTATVLKTSVGQNGPSTRATHAGLTDRERVVLQLMVDGCSVKDLAVKLGIAMPTAYAHRRHIMHKLQIPDLGSLITYAIREGLTSA